MMAGKRNKSAPKLKYGVFVGIHPRTSEALVANSHGAFRARAIKRLIEGSRWDASMMKEIKGVPWDLKTDKRVEADIPLPLNVETPPMPEVPEPVTRKFYIKRKDVEQFGLTDGCPGCRCISRKASQVLAHSDKCRDRIKKLSGATEEGADRVEKRRKIEDEAFADYGTRVLKQQRTDEPKEGEPSQSLASSSVVLAQKRANNEDEDNDEDESKRRRLQAIECDDNNDLLP